jgi:hypothetical protein
VTNRELLRAPPEKLSQPDRQRRRALAVESAPVPCPVCATSVDAITAAGLDVDQYSFGARTPTYRCPHCGAVLDRVTPLVALGPGWHWALNRPWLAGRLRRAERYDAEHPAG